MVFDAPSIFAYVFGLFLIYVFCWLFIRPFKWLFRLLISGVLGGVMLVAVNILGGFAGLQIAVNPLTALVAGVLGVPGVVLLFLLQLIL